MPKFYRSREGAGTDVNTKNQLTTLGSQTAPGALLVPGAAQFIRAVYVACTGSNESATQAAYLVRMEGPGVHRGTFNIAAGAVGGAVATGGTSCFPSTRLPVNIKCIPGQEILVFAEEVGNDQGTQQFAVTLEFGSEAGPEGEAKAEITVEGDLT